MLEPWRPNRSRSLPLGDNRLIWQHKNKQYSQLKSQRTTTEYLNTDLRAGLHINTQKLLFFSNGTLTKLQLSMSKLWTPITGLCWRVWNWLGVPFGVPNLTQFCIPHRCYHLARFEDVLYWCWMNTHWIVLFLFRLATRSQSTWLVVSVHYMLSESQLRTIA